MSIRFIHTADWQLGMKAAGVGKASQKVRDVRLDSIDKIIDTARQRDIKLILITGDVFEDNAVDRLMVRKVGDKLSRFDGQIYIIPGNHDPLVPGSVWDHPVWNEYPTLKVIKDNSPIELENCILYPCPLTEKYSIRNPTILINAHDSDKIAIGLAHGNVEGLPAAEPDYPIPRDAASRTGLDYLALGHWHSVALYPDEKNDIRMAYSGTHETTKFGERDSGNILAVQIDGRGASPQIEQIQTGNLIWKSISARLEQEGEIESLLNEIKALEYPERTLLRLQIAGLLFSSDQSILGMIEEVVSTRFMFGFTDKSTLYPAPEDDTWIEELPAGYLREAADIIRKQAIHGSDDQSRAIATQALIRLFEIRKSAAL